MVGSENLDIEYLASNSDQPEVPVNNAIDKFDAKITGYVDVGVGATNTVALSQDEQAEGSIFYIVAGGSPGPNGAITVNFAAFGMGVFAVVNQTAFSVTLQILGQAMTPPVLLSNATGIFFCDGSNVQSGAGSSGAVSTLTASENLAAGAMVNIWNSSGAKMRNANATDNTKPAHGFVLAAVTSGHVGIFYGPGQINNQLVGLTPGTAYFLDTTNGDINAVAPSSSGNLIQELGVALSATQLIFSPKSTLVV